MNHIRKVICAFLFFLCAVPSASADNQNQETWKFDVEVDGNSIGTHHFKKTYLEKTLLIESTAKFDVKVLFVNIFKYRHENKEIWENGCVSSIESKTTANRKKFRVSAEKREDQLNIRTIEESKEYQGCIMTFAYWNKEFLEQTSLVNTQTGELVEVEITQLDEKKADLSGYLIESKGGPIKVWYSDSRWVALESKLKNGRTLTYQLTHSTDSPDR